LLGFFLNVGAALRGRPQDGNHHALRVTPTIFKSRGGDCLLVFVWFGCGYAELGSLVSISKFLKQKEVL